LAIATVRARAICIPFGFILLVGGKGSDGDWHTQANRADHPSISEQTVGLPLMRIPERIVSESRMNTQK